MFTIKIALLLKFATKPFNLFCPCGHCHTCSNTLSLVVFSSQRRDSSELNWVCSTNEKKLGRALEWAKCSANKTTQKYISTGLLNAEPGEDTAWKQAWKKVMRWSLTVYCSDMNTNEYCWLFWMCYKPSSVKEKRKAIM